MSSLVSPLSLSKQLVLGLTYLSFRGSEQSLYFNPITHAHSLDLKKKLVEGLEGLLLVGYNLIRVVCFLNCKLSNIHE